MKFLIRSIVFLLPVLIFAQSQIGNNINGEADNDLSGNSIALSAEGNIVAVGAYLNDGNGDKAGQVRVFKNNNGIWTQIGQDIDGEASKDYLGKSVALSSNGTILAIGVPWNDSNGINSGEVKIYKNIGNVWTQIGKNIYGKYPGDQLGYHVSLSADGSILAIGAPYNSNHGKFKGQVQIYKNSNKNSWTQIGNSIYGKAIGDLSGLNVSLANNGEIVAIGAPSNSEKGENAGQVRIFRNTNNNWSQLGQDINGETEGDQSGTSVSLSENGETVAIGATHNSGNGLKSGHVRIFSIENNSWTQIGQDINGENAGDISGWKVSLAADGNTVAIGAPQNSENGKSSGQVRVFKNVANNWVQEGTSIYGETIGNNLGESVQLSSNGTIAAIGAPSNHGNGKFKGRVQVYSLNTVKSSSQENFVSQNFNVFPNPTNTQFQLTFSNQLEVKSISLLNNFKQHILQTTTPFIDASNLNKGVYYIQVDTNKGIGVKKVLVQ